MTFRKFSLIAPPHTPFHADGSLALEVVEKQAAYFAATTVNGVFVGGSTGECASLTVDERMALAERWMAVGPQHDLEVLVQVGHSCQADAVRLAAHAQRIGADAVSAHAPSYFRPANVDALIDFLAPIAAAASDVPFYFYDIPPATMVRLPMVEFLTKARGKIPNLRGLKYSNEDLVQLQECLQVEGGDYQIFFGSDEVLLAAAALGVHGAIGSTYNFVAPWYRNMLAALETGDFRTARQWQTKAVTLVRRMMSYGFMAACKSAMQWFGMDCGPVRAPFRNLSAVELETLRQDLDRLGVFTPVTAANATAKATHSPS